MEREESVSLGLFPLFGEPRGPHGGRGGKCLVSNKNYVNKVPHSGAGRTEGFGNRKAHSHGGDGEGSWIPCVAHWAVQEELGRRRFWEGKTVDRGMHEGGPLTGVMGAFDRSALGNGEKMVGGTWTVCKQLTSAWSVWVDAHGVLPFCLLLGSLRPGAPLSISHNSVFS